MISCFCTSENRAPEKGISSPPNPDGAIKWLCPHSVQSQHFLFSLQTPSAHLLLESRVQEHVPVTWAQIKDSIFEQGSKLPPPSTHTHTYSQETCKVLQDWTSTALSNLMLGRSILPHSLASLTRSVPLLYQVLPVSGPLHSFFSLPRITPPWLSTWLASPHTF